MSKKWFIIEGNIGSGKSTLLNMLKLLPDTEVIYEPVDVWLNIKDKNDTNLLQHFYDDMEKYSYMFQTMVFNTRLQALDKQQEQQFRFSERSIWTDKHVFGKMCIKNNNMSSIEACCYNYWFDWLGNKFNPQPDGIIYVKCSPEKCMDRINKRGREEETNISLDYLTDLHKYHEDWINNWTETPVIILNNEVDNNWGMLIDQINNFII
jgi:deoxycitidine kinase